MLHLGSLSRCYVNVAAGHALLTGTLNSNACGHQSCTRIHCGDHLYSYNQLPSYEVKQYAVKHSVTNLLLMKYVLPVVIVQTESRLSY